MATTDQASVAEVTLVPAIENALDLLRIPPMYPGEVHRTVEAVELMLSAALTLYQRAAEERS